MIYNTVLEILGTFIFILHLLNKLNEKDTNDWCSFHLKIQKVFTVSLSPVGRFEGVY